MQEQIPISFKNLKTSARLFVSILNGKNFKYFKKLALELDKYVNEVPVDSQKRTTKLYDKLLDSMFRLTENTNFKSAIIKWHNNYFRGCSGEIRDYCSSNEYRIHNIQSLDDLDENNKFLDIVTKDFIQTCKYGSDDEKMQKTAYWANRIAHGCENEINTFADEFLGKYYNQYQVAEKHKEFLKKIRKANKKFTDEQWRFDEADLQNEIMKEDFDINISTNPNVLKALALAKEVKLNINSPEMLRDFVYCNKLESAAKNFHAIKDTSTVDLINYLKNPNIDEEDKNLVVIKVPDKKMKNQEGEALTRVVVINKEIYEEYFKNNTSLFFSNTFLSQFVDDKSKNKESEINKLREKLTKQYNDRMIDEESMKILMEIGAVSVYHIPNSELIKNNIELDEPCSPLVECAANYASPIADISPSIEKDDVLRKRLDEKGVKENIVNIPEGKEKLFYSREHKSLHDSAKKIYSDITEKDREIGG